MPQIGAHPQPYGIQFLTVPTADTTGTTVALNFNRKRYLFGHISEGTQRAVIQRGFGLRRIYNLFLTGPTKWSTNGGLLGTILTLADVLITEINEVTGLRPRLNIHGPPKLLHTLAAARRFIFRTGMPISVHEATVVKGVWPEEPSYVDENIRVWSISILNARADRVEQQPEDIETEQAMRTKIVNDMFDSDWRRDRLIEKSFKDVKLPAMVFIRTAEQKGLVGVQCANHESATQIALDQKVWVRNPWPASLVGNLPSADNLASDVSVAYVVRGHPQRGAFDVKKAKALGVKPGPAYNQLTEGKSITLEDGTVITPDVVMAPTRVGKGVAFFDLPTIGHADYLQELLGSSSDNVLEDVSTVVWILGPELGSSTEFRQLLHRVQGVTHLVSDPNRAANHLTYDSSALNTFNLARINPGSFFVPVYDNQSPYHEGSTELREEYGTEVVQVKPGLKVTLEPKHDIDETEVPPFDSLEALNQIALPEDVITAPTPALAADVEFKDLEEPEIIPLGTGSSSPSKYRNVSATLIRLPHGQGNVLLDCGENTIGQIKRAFPRAQFEAILRDTQALWISHLHADHHLGTVTFLQARAEAFDALDGTGKVADRTIYLMSEQNMIDFVDEYSSVEPSLLTNTGVIPLVCKPDVGPTLNSEPFDLASTSSALQRVQTVRVSHCAGAQAVSITFKSGFKVSYSGDCRPSNQFCRIGRDSDLLIHEATFDDEMQNDAFAKKHSTISEALGVAIEMHAKNVMLTHFSQRYPKMPNFNSIRTGTIKYEEAGADEDAEPVETDPPPPSGLLDLSHTTEAASQQTMANAQPPPEPIPTTGRDENRPASISSLPICVAFDYMRIRISQIPYAHKYYPAIQKLFDLQDEASASKREAGRLYHEGRIAMKKGRTAEQKAAKAAKVQAANEARAAAKLAQKEAKKHNSEAQRKRAEVGEAGVVVAGETGEPQTSRPTIVGNVAENGVLQRGDDVQRGEQQSPPMSNRAKKRAAKARREAANALEMGQGKEEIEQEGESPEKKQRVE